MIRHLLHSLSGRMEVEEVTQHALLSATPHQKQNGKYLPLLARPKCDSLGNKIIHHAKRNRYDPSYIDKIPLHLRPVESKKIEASTGKKIDDTGKSYAEKMNGETSEYQDRLSLMRNAMAQNAQLRGLIRKKRYESNIKKGKKMQENVVKKDVRPFDFAKYGVRKVMLKFAYLGWGFESFEMEEGTQNTVEDVLFESLIKTKLIKDRPSADYHRCVLYCLYVFYIVFTSSCNKRIK